MVDQHKAQRADMGKKYRSISLALVAVIVVAGILLMVNLSPQPPVGGCTRTGEQHSKRARILHNDSCNRTDKSMERMEPMAGNACRNE